MSYSDYDFCLYWEDLPEEFRTEKVDQIIQQKLENGDYDKEDPDVKEGIRRPELEEVLISQKIRDNLENWITAHFPMYF